MKLKGYLKPFLGGLALAIALLFLQAMCDLNLPNYMSDIVNVGIQQSGIEHAAPEAITEQGMAFVSAFAGEEDRALLAQGYELVNAADTDARGRTYASRYPDGGEQLYVRKKDADLAALDNAFGAASWTFINAAQEAQSAMGGEQQSLTADMQDIDLKGALYPRAEMMAQMLPAQMLDAAREKALAQDASILRQTGVMFAKAFYTDLGVNPSSLQTAYVLRIGGMMLLVTLIGGIATVLVGLIASRMAAGVARTLRRDVFAKIEQFSQTEFDRFSTASLITRCTQDITNVQMLIGMGIRMICYAPIMGIGGIIMAVNKAVSMSWIIAAAVVVLLGIIMVVMGVALPKFKLMQKLVDRLNLVSRENLSGMMVIRAFGTQKHEAERFDVANQNLSRTTLFTNRVMSFMMPVMNLVMNGVTLTVVWVGAHQITNSSMQVGDMLAFMQYAMQILMSFMMIAMMFVFVPRSAVSADRIAEVLNTELVIRDPEQSQAFDPAKRGVVEFRNVCFRYDGAEEDALHDLTFTALPGQTTAIIGPTGSGKSTVASLMLRFFDATQGQVLVGGTDVRQVTQKELRGKIGYVPQRGNLLSGTIASNLSYGRPEATAEELRAAAAVAQATGFIDEKPEGLESEIAQGGSNVSGGQRQRLAIARALAKNPEVLIFDDSFSALDFKTDAALRKALWAHTGQSTMVVIAQRVGTILHADQIIVLDEGKIVGRGTHRELLKTCPLYQEIASSQLSKEELA